MAQASFTVIAVTDLASPDNPSGDYQNPKVKHTSKRRRRQQLAGADNSGQLVSSHVSRDPGSDRGL